MKIVTHLVVITTEFCNKSFSVLSLDENKIIFPTIELTEDNRNKLYSEAYQKIMKLLPSANELEIIPQITTYHSSALGNDPGIINMVFGYLVSYADPSDMAHWFSINYTDTKNKYIPTIFEVVQRLK